MFFKSVETAYDTQNMATVKIVGGQHYPLLNNILTSQLPGFTKLNP
jgi:hypothetical protein